MCSHFFAFLTSSCNPYQRFQKPSDLKTQLDECANTITEYKITDFSIGHRGAGLQYPEHTIEGYLGAIRQGAGIIECDVTFTKDLHLVCRHAQCDLHTTTDVLLRPDLAPKCSAPFEPGKDPLCCTTDFTLDEIKTLCAKMDGYVPGAQTPEEYVKGTPGWRTNLYSYECPKIPTHKESIELFKFYGRKMTPDLKKPHVDMPYREYYTHEKYAQQLIDEYIEAGVPPQDVYPQSFMWEYVYYWMQNTEYGDQAVALDITANVYNTEKEALEYLKPLLDNGVKIYAPAIFKLLTLDDNKNIVPSAIAMAAKNSGMDIIVWTLERAGPLNEGGGGWYFQTIPEVVKSDGIMYEIVDILAKDVGVMAIFSDWPATGACHIVRLFMRWKQCYAELKKIIITCINFIYLFVSFT